MGGVIDITTFCNEAPRSIASGRLALYRLPQELNPEAESALERSLSLALWLQVVVVIVIGALREGALTVFQFKIRQYLQKV